MEFINRIEINKHEIIIEQGKRLATLLDGEEENYVSGIVKKSEKHLKNIGEGNNVVYSPTKRELATFKCSFKRYVRTDFIDPAISRINFISPEDETLKTMCGSCSRKKIGMYSVLPDLCEDCGNKFDYMVSIHSTQWKRAEMIEGDFDKALGKTIIPDELMGNWILLMRKMKDDKESKHIDNALKDFIRNELMSEFIAQNKQLIKKYQLWQSQ